MKLNHLNLPVPDPIATQEFLVRYFGLEPMGKPNPRISFVTDEQGMVLSLSNVSLTHETTPKYPANFHIGFVQESENRVNEIHADLIANGYTAPAPSSQHGSWTFYFEAPGGFTIEVLS